MGLLSNVLSQSGKTQKSDRRSGVRPGETVSLKCARKDMKFIYLVLTIPYKRISCQCDKIKTSKTGQDQTKNTMFAERSSTDRKRADEITFNQAQKPR